MSPSTNHLPGDQGGEAQQCFDVAIIIAVMNGDRSLGRTLDSIACQKLRPRQVLVLDGGSTDGTLDILKSRSDVVTYWHSRRDKGIYDAWNAGLDLVEARWVMFLGSDDFLWDDGVLLRYAQLTQGLDPRIPYVYGRLKEIGEDGSEHGESGVPWEFLKPRWKCEAVVPHPGMLHNHAVLFKGKRFDPQFKVAGDYALLRRPLMESDPLFVDFVVAGAQVGGVSNHPLKRWKSVHEWGVAIEKEGARKPLRWYYVWYKNKVRFWLAKYLGVEVMEHIRSVFNGASKLVRGGRP